MREPAGKRARGIGIVELSVGHDDERMAGAERALDRRAQQRRRIARRGRRCRMRRAESPNTNTDSAAMRLSESREARHSVLSPRAMLDRRVERGPTVTRACARAAGASSSSATTSVTAPTRSSAGGHCRPARRAARATRIG